MNFAAIDFETANRHRSSICSVGVVVVRNGEVAEKVYRLVRPRPNFYSRFNTEVHGLTGADTDEAPEFEDVWPEIDALIDGLPLVAHNAPFDEGACGPRSTFTACLTPAISFSAPARRRAATSGGSCPIISCIPWRPPAVMICRTIIMLWPTRRPARRSR